MQESISELNVQQQQITKMFEQINKTTNHMNNIFQQAILKHEEQFIRCYRTKIHELVSLYNQLKQIIQNNIINNVISNKLQTVIQERDYFKYQSLKLNSQYQSLLQNYKNVNAQMVNTTEQMKIYKQLLQGEKIRNSQISYSTEQLRKNLTQLTTKTVQQKSDLFAERPIDYYQGNKKQNKKISTNDNKHKETIRMLKGRITQCESIITQNEYERVQKKELYEVFRICVDSWKRQIVSKSRKMNVRGLNSEQNLGMMMETISSFKKKELLTLFFTHPDFLKFIEELLFDERLKVTFQKSNQQQLINKNRLTLCGNILRKQLHSPARNFHAVK